MNIYAFINSIPDNVSNPLTANNIMIMISSLKDKFGDKIHETTRKGYLTAQDMIPYKYYKLYLWYWCDECTYGIRECTAKDFNIKEEYVLKEANKMTKEEALQKIKELKEYVEKCEEKEKEKEIPEMPRNGNYNVHMTIYAKSCNAHLPCDRSFENPESANLYSILSFELANLIYVREYLDVKSIPADQDSDDVYRLVYEVYNGNYKVHHYGCIDPCEDEIPWFFMDRKAAEKVRDYMNRYVAPIKKEMH